MPAGCCGILQLVAPTLASLRKPDDWLSAALLGLNVLSLDALLVATLWAALIERWFVGAGHFTANAGAWLGLGCSVCGIYSLDRLLDTREGIECPATVRHRFARRHRWIVKAELAVSFVGGLYAAAIVGRHIVEGGLILVLLVSLYLRLVHAAPGQAISETKKEFAVAVLFSAGVFLPAWTALGARGGSLGLPFAATVALIWLNTYAITNWEAGLRGRIWGWCFGLGVVALALVSVNPFFAAVAVSAVLLAILDLLDGRIRSNTMRLAADFAIILPAVVIRAL